jgi:hypothetical protein
MRNPAGSLVITPSAPQGLMRDAAGRTYTDHYKLVIENESRSEWEPLLAQLKRHFQVVSRTLILTPDSEPDH